MKILRINQVAEITGLSPSTIYKLMREGNFPKSILITKRATGWPDKLIRDWIDGIVKRQEGENEDD